MILTSLILAGALLLSTPALAGEPEGRVTGFVYEEFLGNKDVRIQLPVQGAHLVLYQADRDSLSSVSGDRGGYLFSKVRPGPIRLCVRKDGYFTEDFSADAEEGETVIYVILKRIPVELKGAAVKATVPPVTHRGDTTVYHAAAVQVMDGDNALEILRQMPGISLRNGTLYADGVPIKRTYVNGRLIYGSNALTPLNAIPAEEVTQIRMYEERSVEDRMRGTYNGRKDRVLDIATKTPIFSAFQAHALASGGLDGQVGEDGKNQLRYQGGISAHFYSEKLLLSLKTNLNNIGRSDNASNFYAYPGGSLSDYHEKAVANAYMEKYWGDRLMGNSLIFNYITEKDYTRSANRALTEYLKTDQTPARMISESANAGRSGLRHNVLVNGAVNNARIKSLSTQHRFSFSSAEAGRETRQEIETAGLQDRSQHEILHEDGRDWSYAGRIDWKNDLSSSGWYPSLDAYWETGNSRNESVRADTLKSTFLKRHLTVDGLGQNWKAGADAAIRKRLIDKPTITLTGSLSAGFNRFSKTRNDYALDLLDPLHPTVDPTNTFNYTWDGMRTYVGTGFTFSSGDLSGTLSFQSSWERILDRESYPETVSEGKVYFLPGILFSLRKKLFTLGYTWRSEAPAIEQFRPRIDDRSPYFLKAGNPDLKPAEQHTLQVGWSSTPFGKKLVSSILIDASASAVRRAIVSQTTYFQVDTHIDGWGGYDAVQGSSLTTFVNANGTWTASANATWQGRIQPWKTSFEWRFGGSRSAHPAYLSERLAILHEGTVSSSLDIQVKPSRTFRVKAGYTIAFTKDWNNLGDNVMDCLCHQPRLDILKQWTKGYFVSFAYRTEARRVTPETTAGTTFHFLDAVVGKTFLKGRLAVSVSGNDLLNSGTRFHITSGSDFRYRQWTPSYGRYFLLNLRFRLNKTQSTTRFIGLPPLDVFTGGM